MKLGIHIIVWNERILRLIIETGASPIKLMNNPDPDPIRKILEAHPDTVIICRRFAEPSEQQSYIDAGVSGGRRWANVAADQYASVATVCRQYGHQPYLESVNEPPLNPYDSAPRQLAIFTEGFADEADRRGFVPVTLCLSVGQPEGDEATRQYLWDQLEPALEATFAASGVVGMHPYGRPPAMDAPDSVYYFGRPRYDRDRFWPTKYRQLRFIYGETGLDGGTLQPPPPKESAGWKAFLKDGEGNPNAAEMARQLRWAVAEINADPGIIGMTPFTHGPTGDWESFGLDGYDEIDAVYREQAAADVPQEETMPKETKITFIGSKDAVAGEVGEITLHFEGIDGQADGKLSAAYPPIPGNDFDSTYGENVLTDLPVIHDGDTVTLAVNTPMNTVPLPPEGVDLRVRVHLLELDGTVAAPITDVSPLDGYGPFPLHVTQRAQAQPAPQPQPAPHPAPTPNPSGNGGNQAHGKAELDDLWAVASAMGQNGDTVNEKFIKDRVIKLKTILKL